MENLQDLLLGQQSTTIGELNLVPETNPALSRENYREKFWSVFVPSFEGRNINGSPHHFPYRVVVAKQLITPSEPATVRYYRATSRARIYPYGAGSVNFGEYIAFERPTNASDLVDYLCRALVQGGRNRWRAGLANDLKSQVIEAFCPHSASLPKPQVDYSIVHVESQDTMDPEKAWNELKHLVSLSNKDQKLAVLRPADYPNFGSGDDMILVGPHATLIWQKGEWTPEHKNGRRCLRNRLWALCELASAQAVVFWSFCDIVRSEITTRRARLSHPLARLRETFRPVLPVGTIVRLKLVLTLQDALNPGRGDDVARWSKWYAAISSKVFPGRLTALASLDSLNDLEVEGIKRTAEAFDAVAERVEGVISAVGRGNA